MKKFKEIVSTLFKFSFDYMLNAHVPVNICENFLSVDFAPWGEFSRGQKTKGKNMKNILK